jgi:two-component system, OmpR family, sensor histidine kinase KdpD
MLFNAFFTPLLRYSAYMEKQSLWLGYACAAAAAAVCTLTGLAMAPRFDIVNIAMVYLLAVVVIALRFSRGAAITSAVLCVASFDLMFVPPAGTFTVHDIQYLFTFAIMLAVALVISGLMERGRRHLAAQTALSVKAESERVRSTLLASISHDLRTPLAVIAGASSSLAEEGEKLNPEERKALAQSVYGQARDMSELVSKVLQMTRLEDGSFEIQRDWTSVAEITGSVLARLRDRLVHHLLVVDIPADLPLVRADAILVEQALANLVENAACHTPAGTAVWVSGQQQGAELVISVEDRGPGIEDRDLETVFTKFHRGKGKHAGAGVGLGLAICRTIIELHGGRVWADRPSSGGAAFRFTLPVGTEPAAPVELA